MTTRSYFAGSRVLAKPYPAQPDPRMTTRSLRVSLPGIVGKTQSHISNGGKGGLTFGETEGPRWCL